MTLTYIFHSGFVLETEQSILLFDYWMDPSGVMDGVLRSEKSMFVPMHFTTGFESSWRMKEFTDEKNILFWEISREGETIKI